MSFCHCPGHHDSQWLCHSRQRHSNLNSSNREPNSETARRSARNCFVTCRDAIDGLAHALLVPQRKIEKGVWLSPNWLYKIVSYQQCYIKCPNRSSKFMRISNEKLFIFDFPKWGTLRYHGHMATGPFHKAPHRPRGSNLMPPAQEKPMNQSCKVLGISMGFL